MAFDWAGRWLLCYNGDHICAGTFSFFFKYQLKRFFFSLLKTGMDLIISTMHHWCNLARCNRPRAINRVAEPSLQSFDELMRCDLYAADSNVFTRVASDSLFPDWPIHIFLIGLFLTTLFKKGGAFIWSQLQSSVRLRAELSRVGRGSLYKRKRILPNVAGIDCTRPLASTYWTKLFDPSWTTLVDF